MNWPLLGKVQKVAYLRAGWACEIGVSSQSDWIGYAYDATAPQHKGKKWHNFGSASA